MSKNKKNPSKGKNQLHPFNKHRGRYNFKELVETCPSLKPFVYANKYNDWSIDFSKPDAVKMLNTALLLHHYNLEYWDIPKDYLCPPIPGRADYIHYIADLIAKKNQGRVIKSDKIKCLDIGIGANCIYPIVGTKEYGWSFVGSDIDQTAIDSCQKIIALNPSLKGKIEVRRQDHKNRIFEGIIQDKELFDVTICNPPFHASKEEVKEASERKFYNLHDTKEDVVSNFAGQNHELFCDGGEKAFINRLIKQSKDFSQSCFWFTTLVSKKSNLEVLYNYLEDAGVTEFKKIAMTHGNKSSRILAWTFLDKHQQETWAKKRWEVETP